MGKTNNGSVPYERQMKRILHNYDQLVEENKMLRGLLSEINKFCPPTKVQETFLAIQRENNSLKSENEDLRRTADVRKQKLEEVEKVVKDGLKMIGIAVPCYYPLVAKIRSLVQMFSYLKEKEGK